MLLAPLASPWRPVVLEVGTEQGRLEVVPEPLRESVLSAADIECRAILRSRLFDQFERPLEAG
jgi:hypothetical protein